jgi:hypothetical protein
MNGLNAFQANIPSPEKFAPRDTLLQVLDFRLSVNYGCFDIFSELFPG